MIGRLVQTAAELTLVAALAAGAQRAAGVEFKTHAIENDYLRSAATAYLRLGDWTVDTVADQMRKHPEWFSRK